MDRRNAIKALSGVAVAAAGTFTRAPSALATALGFTPPQALGPYYPRQADRMAMYGDDRNNDLTVVAGLRDEADGGKLYLLGTVYDEREQPLPGVDIEIWQACHAGRYNHPGDEGYQQGPKDPKFQYWSVFTTNEVGQYAMRTIVPPAYPSGIFSNWFRPPHIHFKLKKEGYSTLITQLYFNDLTISAEENEHRHKRYQRKDGILRMVKGQHRDRLIASLTPAGPELDARLAAHGLSFRDDTEENKAKWGVVRVGTFDIRLHRAY